MIVKDLFNFIYQNLEERKLMESILTIVDCYPEGRGARIHHGFVNPKEVSLSDLDSEIASGYYVYQSIAHFDDEYFHWYEDLRSATKAYKKENIHKRPCLVMEKRLLRVSGEGIEQLKFDKWKDNK